jgi:hypothetical protein
LGLVDRILGQLRGGAPMMTRIRSSIVGNRDRARKEVRHARSSTQASVRSGGS